jgi:hypothetical protein
MLPCRAIGIIFGDVGTSPLYVFASIFQDPPDHHDLMGATSMIFWTITLVALIKYVPGFPVQSASGMPKNQCISGFPLLFAFGMHKSVREGHKDPDSLYCSSRVLERGPYGNAMLIRGSYLAASALFSAFTSSSDYH